MKNTAYTTLLLIIIIHLSLGATEVQARTDSHKETPRLNELFAKYRSKPVEGQNFWHLAPQDLYPGTVSFSGKSISDVTDDSFMYVPNTVWGTYIFKVTRLNPKPNSIDRPKYPSRRLRNMEMRFTELKDTVGDRQLSLNGRIVKIEDDGKRILITLPFIGEDVLCSFDIIESDPIEKLKLIISRNIPYGPHWRQVIDFYQVKCEKYPSLNDFLVYKLKQPKKSK